jgi:GH35 family endo-1,4-beta-xylanase
MWPRHQSSPDFIQAILDEPSPTNAQLQELYDATFNHINDIGSATAGKIYAWDAVNEPRTSFDIEDKLIGFTPAGQSSAISSRTDLRKQWFEAGKAVDPNARMVLNDFGILPGGDATNSRRADDLAILRDLVAADTPVEGIGFQSHFKDLEFRPNGARIATGIPHVLSLLDSYESEFGVPIEITEFDFQSNDDDLKADYTRDFLTAAFSHESVDSFHLWGFWEGKMANPEGALFDMDFNLTPNGEEFFRLIEEEWWTSGMGRNCEVNPVSDGSPKKLFGECHRRLPMTKRENE